MLFLLKMNSIKTKNARPFSPKSRVDHFLSKKSDEFNFQKIVRFPHSWIDENHNENAFGFFRCRVHTHSLYDSKNAIPEMASDRLYEASSH